MISNTVKQSEVLIPAVPIFVYLLQVTIVTGSVKTGHNRTSLNLQYKALNTLGAYLRIVKKIP